MIVIKSTAARLPLRKKKPPIGRIARRVEGAISKIIMDTNKLSRTQNSIKNLKYSTVNKFVTMFLSLLGRNVFLRILPIEYLGINGVFSDIFMIMSMADLGLTTAMSFSFYQPLAEGDQEKISALVTLYRKLYNLIASVIAIIGISLLPFLEYFVNTDISIPHS